MLRSFADKMTEQVWQRHRVRQLHPDIAKKALRKLSMMNVAASLHDLAVPPSNRLEPLKGDRRGQHSIRINDQYRICFVWTPAGPEDIEITDYHH